MSLTWCSGCWSHLPFTLATCVVCCHRLKRENVIFLVQEQHPGFIYDSVQRLFVKVESEGEGVARQQPNSGVALSQVGVGWEGEGEGLTLNPFYGVVCQKPSSGIALSQISVGWVWGG